jgi:Cu/Ag efflux pump CusA
MTAAAAALGVLPLVLGEPAGKELERPMAYVILGGLCTSTVLNMLVVPAVFATFGWEREEMGGPQEETPEAVFVEQHR